LKTNVTPTEQIRVGPGISETYDWKPRDGFHTWYRPDFRNVDELRVNPKNTYGGRLLPGQERVQNRGLIGQTYKRRPDTFWINDPRRWFKTTGSYTAPQVRENFVAYKQNREDTNVEYTGIAGNPDQAGPYTGVYLEGSDVTKRNGGCSPMAPDTALLSQVRHTDRNQLPGTGQYTHVHSGQIVKQQKYLYDKARPTIKEGTHVMGYQGQVGAVEGNRKNQKYLDDKARPTIKETTHVMGYQGQVGNEGIRKNQKYLDDKARPTIKETTHVLGYQGQVGNEGIRKNQKYLDDKARPTIKETTHVLGYQGQVGNEGIRKNQKYLDDKARTTIKETTHVIGYQGQAGAPEGNRKNQKYLYDKARPTVKETTHVMGYQGQAGAEGIRKNQKYLYDKARPTVRETTHVLGYQGQAGAEGIRKNQKYLYDKARPTTKETTHVINYMGQGGTSDTTNPTSYEAMYNATTNNNQEDLLQGRTFGPNKSTNISIGSCDINMQIKQRTGYDITKYGPNENRLYTAIPNIGDNFQNTTSQNQRDQPGIRQPEDFVVSQFERNPYSQSLNSAPRITSPFRREEIPFENK
jgi:hypothetical protein